MANHTHTENWALHLRAIMRQRWITIRDYRDCGTHANPAGHSDTSRQQPRSERCLCTVCVLLTWPRQFVGCPRGSTPYSPSVSLSSQAADHTHKPLPMPWQATPLGIRDPKPCIVLPLFAAEKASRPLNERIRTIHPLRRGARTAHARANATHSLNEHTRGICNIHCKPFLQQHHCTSAQFHSTDRPNDRPTDRPNQPYRVRYIAREEGSMGARRASAHASELYTRAVLAFRFGVRRCKRDYLIRLFLRLRLLWKPQQ